MAPLFDFNTAKPDGGIGKEKPGSSFIFGINWLLLLEKVQMPRRSGYFIILFTLIIFLGAITGILILSGSSIGEKPTSTGTLTVPQTPSDMPTLGNKIIIVGGDNAYPPYSYLENGKATGFDNDLIRAVAEVMGVEVQFRLSSWAEAKQNLVEGKVDMIGGMAFSDERDLVFDFTRPHSVHYSDLFTRKNSTIKSLDDMIGKSIVVQQGDIMHDYLLQSGFDGEIIIAESPEKALQMVASGEHDGALVNSLIGYYYINKNGLTNLKGLDLHLLERNYGFVVQDGNRQLVQSLNEGLAIVDATGKYEKINDQWFGVFRRQSTLIQYQYLLYGLIAMATTMGAIGLWVWSLREQVQSRTAAFQKSEAKYYSLINRASVGAVVSKDDQMVYMNPHAMSILGVSEKPVFPIDLDLFVDQDDLDRLDLFVKKMDDESEPYNEEMRLHTIDGQVRWVDMSLAKIEWETEPAVLGFFTDITEAKRVRELIQEREKRYRLLFQESPVGLFYYDQDLIITHTNDQLSGILRMNKEELESFSLRKLNDSKILPAVEAILREEDGYYEGDFSPPGATDGKKAFIKLKTTPIHNEQDRLQGGLGLIEDITADVANQQRIKSLEERITKAFRTSPDAIVTTRLRDGFFYDTNRGFTELTGYEPEEVIGNTSQQISFWVDFNDRQRLVAGLMADGEVKNLETQFRKKNGELIYGSMSASLIEIDEEKYIISIIRNISDRKLAEETIRLSEARYRSIYETVPVSIMEQDYLQAYDLLMELRSRGVSDLRTYFKEHPDFPFKVARTVKVNEVNQKSLAMYEVNEKEDLLVTLDKLLDRDGYENFENELIAIWEGKTLFEGETINRTLDGQKMIVQVLIQYPEKREDFRNVLVSITDITSRKKAEDELRESENRYRSIFNMVPVSIWEEDFSDVAILMEEWRDNGVKDLDLYLRQNPQQLHEAASLVKILEINEAALAVFGAKSRKELLDSLQKVFTPEAYDTFRNELVAFWNKRPKFMSETTNRTIDGRVINVFLSTNSPDFASGQTRVLVSVEDVTERKKAEEQIQKQLEHLAALRAVDLAISASLDLPVTLRVLANQAVKHLGVDAAVILLINPENQHLEYSAGSGFNTAAIQKANIKLGEGYAGKVAQERKIVIANDLATNASQITTKDFSEEGFTDFIGIPLIAKNEVKGVLELFNRSRLPADPEWTSFLESMARQAAIAIDNATLYTEARHANILLRRSYDATIEGWAHALELRDRETEGHSIRVAELTTQLAERVGLQGEDLINIRYGALLHDIGKMGIPDQILLKESGLTDEEWDIMKKHPMFARDLLGGIQFLSSAVEIPFSHHEKWDGTGYPNALKGEEIPLSGRIFAVVDCWDALRSDRPYRTAWSDEKVWKHIEQNSGKSFDPAIVEKFRELMGRKSRRKG